MTFELPEETSFCLLGLNFTWSESHKSPLPRLLQGKWASFRAQHFLTPDSYLYLYKSSIQPCVEYCSHIWGGAPRSQALLDRVQIQVVSSVCSGLSADLQALPHSRDVVSLVLEVLRWEIFHYACKSHTYQTCHC